MSEDFKNENDSFDGSFDVTHDDDTQIINQTEDISDTYETEPENFVQNSDETSEKEQISEPVDEKPTDIESQDEPEIPYVEAEQVNNQNAPRNPYSTTNGSYASYENPQPGQNTDSVQPQQDSKKAKKGTRIFLSAMALILVFALGVGCATLFKSGFGGSKNTEKEKSTYDSAELTINSSPTSPVKYEKGAVLTAAQIADKVRPSNVGIVVYSGGSSSASGEGSGVIMGEDSTHKFTYIITCAHVISGAGIKANVQTEDGQSYEAEIVGYDTRTDLGVLKIKATGFKAAEFGDSDALSIGDVVYAIGNPGGVEFFGSFTGGYVSAINRPVSSEIGYTMKCIQHDASINPGNSGGMLVNQYGHIIGINSQKIADTSYEGMGFAIPITSAKEIIDDLIEYSYVPNRPKLGITYYPVSASTRYSMIAQIKGLPAGTLIINEIGSDSSLANTNARQYDMIIAVNGEPLTTADVLLELIDKGKVGDKLTLTLCRVNSNYSIDEFDIEVTLVEDKGTEEVTTTQPYINPFDYFYNGY